METLPMLAVAVVVLVLLVVAFMVLSKPKPFLDKKRKRVKILDIKELSKDTKRFRLCLGHKDTPLGLPVGGHVKLFAPNPESSLATGTWNGKEDREKAKEVSRSYTPTPSTVTCGHVDLVIKMYRPGTFKMPNGQEVVWADGGKMSQYLDAKVAGDEIEIDGPTGLHEYLGRGQFRNNKAFISSNRYGLIAGGAGITPMLQLVWAALHDPKDTCTFSMIYANKTEDDILCRDIIDEMVRDSKGRFSVHYTLDFPPPAWPHLTGFITQEMIKKCLPPADLNPIVVMCGPPPMLQFACKPNLEALGYAKNMTISF
jgi:cytochrome-b5 reductase